MVKFGKEAMMIWRMRDEVPEFKKETESDFDSADKAACMYLTLMCI